MSHVVRQVSMHTTMHTMSVRCAHTARAICCTLIAVASSGCVDAPPGEQSDAALPGPSANTPKSFEDGDASPASVDAVSDPPVAPRDSVDEGGVRGALVDVPFLAEMGDGTKSLVLVDWEIPPNSERYLCGRLTVPEDVYFDQIHAVNPLGTHHTALGLLDRPNRPDGVTSCDLSELARRSIDASGVRTVGGKMPPGVAMKTERGAQLLLNLHLFNTSDAPLRGRSGVQVTTVAPSEVMTLADAVAAGPMKLAVPPGQSVQTGVCSVEYDYEVFSVFPHMHEMGRYMKVVARRAAGEPVVLYDGPFDFMHQFAYAVDPPLALGVGDSVEIACTYDNNTGEVLHFGESSRDEMCLVQLARFPGGGRSSCPF